MNPVSLVVLGRLGWLHQPSIAGIHRKRCVGAANPAYGPLTRVSEALVVTKVHSDPGFGPEF